MRSRSCWLQACGQSEDRTQEAKPAGAGSSRATARLGEEEEDIVLQATMERNCRGEPGLDMLHGERPDLCPVLPSLTSARKV